MSLRSKITEIVELMEFSRTQNTQGDFKWTKRYGNNDYLVIYYQSDNFVGINVIDSKTDKSVRTNVVWSVEEFLIDLNKEFGNELRKRKIEQLL